MINFDGEADGSGGNCDCNDSDFNGENDGIDEAHEKEYEDWGSDEYDYINGRKIKIRKLSITFQPFCYRNSNITLFAVTVLVVVAVVIEVLVDVPTITITASVSVTV